MPAVRKTSWAKGDMLYLPPGSSSLRRGQGVWVKDEEIDAVIDHAKSQGTPEYDESIFKVGAAAMGGGGNPGGESNDWVNDREFHDAVWSIYKHNKTGADFLRRKCQIGYNKATAFVETLEDLGFLGPQKGSKGRELLRSWDDWLDSYSAKTTWKSTPKCSSATPIRLVFKGKPLKNPRSLRSPCGRHAALASSAARLILRAKSGCMACGHSMHPPPF